MEPYHYWKFRAALDALAGGEAPLRTRILYALMSFAGVRDQDLPEPVREIYLELRAHTTWKIDGDPDQGSWKNTLEAMSDEDAEKVVGLFVKLFEVTCRHMQPEPHSET